MPESSAKAGLPVASAATRAFTEAFSANVAPVSGGSSTWSGSGITRCGASSGANSRSLWGLRVARTSSIAASASARRAGRERGLLRLAQLLDPGGREREQVVEGGARKRRALGGGLHLDETAVAGHDDVGVDLRSRVLGVVEVEQRH